MSITFKAIAVGAVLCGMAAVGIFAAEPEWNPAAIKECDRACLVDFMNRYMDAIYKHDTKLVPPLALGVRMTENTGHMDVGEGMLWRSKVEPTTFNLIAADPVEGQVSLQARVKIQGRNNLIAVRLKIDRGQILEIEQLWANGINDAAIPLLTTPRETLTTDIRRRSGSPAKYCCAPPTLTSTRWRAMTARSRLSPTIACAMKTAIRRSTIHRPADA